MDPFDTNETTVVEVDPNKDYLVDLVGEGKKYKDEKALAYAAVHKDLHISNLEKELSGIREELKARTTMQEFMDKLKTQGQQSQQTTQQDPPAGDEDEKKATTPEELEALVEATLNKRQTQAQRSSNYQTVVSKLQDAFGENASKIVKAQAQQLGMSLENLKKIAEETPAAFLRLVGVDQPQSVTTEADLFSGPIRSTTSTPSLGAGNVKNEAYWEKIRQTNPNHYWSKEVQKEVHRSAMALGEKFYN